MTSTRTLTYKGLVDPAIGTQMGPSLNGRMFAVVGSVYDTETDRTEVSLEQVSA